MRCQYCNCAESKVIDSRPTEEGNSITLEAKQEEVKEEKNYQLKYMATLSGLFAIYKK